MNWDRVEGRWKLLKGKVREQWGKLTDDDLDQIAGQRERLAGHLQQAYGLAQDEVEKQIKDFEKKAEQNKWVQ
ncbi:MAG TPA: CsbD family protein [Usitatibacter sp.]|nr:CsbD family protein [Usitatibacter sp.]